MEAKKRPAPPVIAVDLTAGAIASLRWNCSSAMVERWLRGRTRGS